MKGFVCLLLICSLVFVPMVAQARNGDVAARYPEDANAGVLKALIVVGGIILLVPVATWAVGQFRKPTPQEKLQLKMKENVYSAVKGRIKQRAEVLPDSVIDQIIIGALGGQPIQAVQPLPQYAPEPELPEAYPAPEEQSYNPAVWRSGPGPGQNNNGGGVYIIPSSRVEEVY